MKIRIVFSGRGTELANALPATLNLAVGMDVSGAIAALRHLLPRGLELPASCLVVVSGKHLGALAAYENCTLCDGDELLFIAPVAGG
jgi:molybdopterin converting factor small subunit